MNENLVRLAKTLTERSLTLASAESLTGGLFGARVTSVPGASKFFLGTVCTYHTSMKPTLLGVSKETIAKHTVVSAEVATEMAIGVQRLTDADWVVSMTGVAGPDAQDGHAPGEVWLCVQGPRVASNPQFHQVEQFQFEGDREQIREATVDAAASMLLRVISPV